MYHLRQTLRIILFMLCASSLTANYFLYEKAKLNVPMIDYKDD